MYYNRHTADSAQKCAADTGDEGLHFPQSPALLQKSVNCTPPAIPYPNSTDTQDESVSDAGGGPLHISHGRYSDPFATWVLPALQAIGQAAINSFQS